MSTNYEAIGRCKVLKEDVGRLTAERNRAITELRETLRGVMGQAQGPVHTFDADTAHRQLREVEKAASELMEAVNDFNHWAPDAGERLITVSEPRRR